MAKGIVIAALRLATMLMGLAWGDRLQAAALQLTTEESPPYNYIDPGTLEVTGIATDVVSEMMRRTGTEFKIELLPWQRAYQQALEQGDTCVYATTLTEDRKPLFKWVTPLASNDWVLLSRDDSPITLNSLEDARPYVIGGYHGDAVAVFLEKNGFKMSNVPRDDLNPVRIAAGRIDLWATGNVISAYLLHRQNITGIHQVLTIRRTDLAFACNRAVPDDLIARLQAALNQMRGDGTVEQVLKKYR